MPSSAQTSRSDVVLLMQEIERIQARFAYSNNTSWVAACDTVLGNCRKLLQAEVGGAAESRAA